MTMLGPCDHCTQTCNDRAISSNVLHEINPPMIDSRRRQGAVRLIQGHSKKVSSFSPAVKYLALSFGKGQLDILAIPIRQ